MTRLEAYAYERIEELETEVEQIKESLQDLQQTLEKIMSFAKDEQFRRKVGWSEESELLTADEWERLRNYHDMRAKVAKDKSSEQWLKEHNCSEEKEKLKEKE